MRMDAEFAHRFFYIPRNGPCDWQLERRPLRHALVQDGKVQTIILRGAPGSVQVGDYVLPGQRGQAP